MYILIGWTCTRADWYFEIYQTLEHVKPFDLWFLKHLWSHVFYADDNHRPAVSFLFCLVGIIVGTELNHTGMSILLNLMLFRIPRTIFWIICPSFPICIPVSCYWRLRCYMQPWQFRDLFYSRRVVETIGNFATTHRNIRFLFFFQNKEDIPRVNSWDLHFAQRLVLQVAKLESLGDWNTFMLIL